MGSKKSEYDLQRDADIKEIARAIMNSDRHCRKYGQTVDTGGAIRRALEKAYQRGKKEEREGEPEIVRPNRPDAMLWALIPRKSRDAFYTICLFLLGAEEEKVKSVQYVIQQQEGAAWEKSQWELHILLEDSPIFEGHTFGDATIRPLLKLGLLSYGDSGDVRNAYLTRKGFETWWERADTASSIIAGHRVVDH